MNVRNSCQNFLVDIELALRLEGHHAVSGRRMHFRSFISEHRLAFIYARTVVVGVFCCPDPVIVCSFCKNNRGVKRGRHYRDTGTHNGI